MHDVRTAKFTAATPEMLAERALLSRTDTKFVLSSARLGTILDELIDHYAVLRVPTGNVATYHSLYFDTPGLQCFHDHRRGRRIRHKIRIREYPDRELSFLEVKTKRNEAVTDKHRLAKPFRDESLGERELAFLHERVGTIADDLRPLLRMTYKRISLIGLNTSERVTIDLDLEVHGGDEATRHLEDLVVIEVKQDPYCVRTPVMQAVRRAGLRERSLSKYMTALALMKPDLRRNRLMPALRSLARP